VELWLNENAILIESQTIKYNEIELLIGPNISPKKPNTRIFGRGGSIIDCFGVGRFLRIPESEKICSLIYSCIPQNARREFIPFASFENFRKTLIFNPKILFSFPGNESDFDSGSVYLVFYFGTHSEQFRDHVFDIQFGQIISGNNNNFFITPYSWYYALFKINERNEIELVRYYGIN
jgi:hypothetical protein